MAPAAHGTAGPAHGSAEIWRVLSDPGPHAQKAREYVFGALRPPPGFDLPKGGMGDMPRLYGDDPEQPNDAPRARLTLTVTQYLLLALWKDGKFEKPKHSPPPETAPGGITPDGLDRAALENCVGGAFYPGIEVGWQIRNPKLFAEPFRIDLAARSAYHGESAPIRAGHFSRQMALPWQADFTDCAKNGSGENEFGWWPGQRPDDLFRTEADVAMGMMRPWARPTPGHTWPYGHELPGKEEMVAHWYKMGFVIRQGEAFIESERADHVP